MAPQSKTKRTDTDATNQSQGDYVAEYHRLLAVAQKRRDRRRAELQQQHSQRIQDLRARITSQMDGLTSSEKIKARRRDQLEILQRLLEQRSSAEARIVASILGFETALNTTTSEVQMSLQERVREGRIQSEAVDC